MKVDFASQQSFAPAPFISRSLTLFSCPLCLSFPSLPLFLVPLFFFLSLCLSLFPHHSKPHGHPGRHFHLAMPPAGLVSVCATAPVRASAKPLRRLVRWAPRTLGANNVLRACLPSGPAGQQFPAPTAAGCGSDNACLTATAVALATIPPGKFATGIKSVPGRAPSLRPPLSP